MNEFSELDLINGVYEEDIDEDRHFDETLVEKRRRPVKFKKGDYVYYVNFHGDTYPTQIYAVGKMGRRENKVLIELKTFNSDVLYRRWVHVVHVRLQVQEA